MAQGVGRTNTSAVSALGTAIGKLWDRAGAGIATLLGDSAKPPAREDDVPKSTAKRYAGYSDQVPTGAPAQMPNVGSNAGTGGPSLDTALGHGVRGVTPPVRDNVQIAPERRSMPSP